MAELDADAARIRACRDIIAKDGHMVAAITGTRPGEPLLAYTIGLSALKRCGYEFAASGFERSNMHNVLNALAGRATAGKLRPVDGLLVEGILLRGYVLRLRPVHPSHRLRWITRVLDLPEQPPIWQAQIPARDGAFPGEPGYNPRPYRPADLTLPAPVDEQGEREPD